MTALSHLTPEAATDALFAVASGDAPVETQSLEFREMSDAFRDLFRAAWDLAMVDAKIAALTKASGA